MPVTATGIARIRHAATGEVYTLYPDELDWESDGGEERQMGPETTYVADVFHPELGLLTWRLWEYPLGAENDREVDVGQHTILSNFDLHLTSGVDLEQREDKVAELVAWFRERFEDPAQRTPYESAEGGYQWIWGGPHDARDELASNFSDLPDHIVDAAVKRVESGGIFEWAPTERPGDYDRDDDIDVAIEPRFEDFERAVSELREPEAGPQFGLDVSARIAFLGWTPSKNLPASGLLDGIREAAALLVADLSGTNAHQSLLEAAMRYAQGVARSSLSIEEIYAEGVFLENAVARLHTEVAAEETPPLPRSPEQSLQTLLDLHGAYIMASAEGRALVEGASAYKRTSEQQATLDKSVAHVAVLVDQAEQIFSPEVRDLVRRAASQTGGGPHPERSNQVGLKIMKGVLIALGFCVQAVAVTVVGDGMAATPLGTAAMGAVTAAGTGVSQLIEHGLAAAGAAIPQAMGAVYTNFIAVNAAALETFAALVGPEFSWLTRLSSLVRQMSR